MALALTRVGIALLILTLVIGEAFVFLVAIGLIQ